MRASMRKGLGATLVAGLPAGRTANAPAPDYQLPVASPDRSDADRVNDLRRKPVPCLAIVVDHTFVKP